MFPDSCIKSYLHEVGRYPLLTPVEEVLLGRQVQAAKVLTKKKEEGVVLTSPEKRTIQIGAKARMRMTRCNLRLVINISKKYMPRVEHLGLMDLIQEGSLGLMRAVDMFDPVRGYRFSTYAYWWIRQAITRGIMTRETAIRLPHTVGEKLPRIRRTASDLSQQLSREPTSAEIAEALDMTQEELALLLLRTAKPTSLDIPSHEEGLALITVIADPDAKTGYDCIDDDYGHLDVAMSQLSEKEKNVLVWRHGLNREKPRSCQNIGNELGISRQNVESIERVALRKLKVFMLQSQRFVDPKLKADVVSNLDKCAHLV